MNFSDLHSFIKNLSEGDEVSLVSFGSVHASAQNCDSARAPVHHGNFVVRSITKNIASAYDTYRVALADIDNPNCVVNEVRSMSGWDANCDMVTNAIRPIGHDYQTEWNNAVLNKMIESIDITKLSDEKRELLMQVLV